MKDGTKPFWKHNKTAILGIPAGFIVSMIGSIPLEFSENAVNAPEWVRSAAEIVGICILMAGTLCMMGCAITIIVRVLRAFVRRMSRRQKETAYDYYPPETKRQARPWWAILFIAVILMPVGVYYAVRKLLEEEGRCTQNGIRLIVFGCFQALIGGAGVAFMWLSGPDTVKTGVSLSVPPAVISVNGLILLVIGLVWRARGAAHDRYMLTLCRDRITDIDKIAQRMHTTYPHAARHIQDLIDLDLLPNAYLHHAKHEVIIPDISDKIAIRCHGCSGTTVLKKNEERICAYCGAQL